MITITDPKTGEIRRSFTSLDKLTPQVPKDVAIQNYVYSHPTPEPESCPDLVLNYNCTIKGVPHIRYYQPTSGKTFLDTNYFLPEEFRNKARYILYQNPAFINYTELSPQKYDNGVMKFPYVHPIESFMGYRMLELSVITINAKKADKTVNSDIRSWEFSNGKSYVEKYGWVPATRAFMFPNDTNLYDAYGAPLAVDHTGKFYNKQVARWLASFCYGKNLDLRSHYYSVEKNIYLFANGEDEIEDPTKTTRFYPVEWYKNITPRTISKKSKNIDDIINDESLYLSLKELNTKYPFNFDVNKIKSQDDIKLNSAIFQSVNDDWDVMRLIKRDIDASKVKGPSSWVGTKYMGTSSSYSSTYVSNSTKLWYHLDQLAELTSNNIVTPNPDYELEYSRILYSRTKHEAYRFEYDSIKKKFVKTTTLYTSPNVSTVCNYVNLEEAKSNPNLAPLLSNIPEALTYQNLDIATTLYHVVKSKMFNKMIDEGYNNIAKCMINNTSEQIQSPDRFIKYETGKVSYKVTDTPESILSLPPSKLKILDECINTVYEKYGDTVKYDNRKFLEVSNLFFEKYLHKGYGIYDIIKTIYTFEEILDMTDKRFKDMIDTLTYAFHTNITIDDHNISLSGVSHTVPDFLPGFKPYDGFSMSSAPAMYISWQSEGLTPIAREYLKKMIERFITAYEDNDLNFIKKVVYINKKTAYTAPKTIDIAKDIINCKSSKELKSAMAKYPGIGII